MKSHEHTLTTDSLRISSLPSKQSQITLRKLSSKYNRHTISDIYVEKIALLPDGSPGSILVVGNRREVISLQNRMLHVVRTSSRLTCLALLYRTDLRFEMSGYVSEGHLCGNRTCLYLVLDCA
jgi:hypothetical protein